MKGITIIGREWVEDPEAPGRRKEVIAFAVTDLALVDSILTVYPHTGDGSIVLVRSDGSSYFLIDGVWL